MFRNYILRIKLIGTSIDEVIQTIERHYDWGAPGINFERGFAPSSPGRRGGPPDGQPDLPRIGEMSVSSYMGSYRAWYRWFPLLEWGVSVFWGFDGNGELIEVFIWKIGMS